MNVLLDLQGLIRCVRDDEICRKNLLKLCKFLIDRLTELCDLVLIAHVDCQGDCTATLPLSSGVQPRVIVQIGGRSLIAGKNLDQIPQINGAPVEVFATLTSPIASLLSNWPEGLIMICRWPVSNAPPGAIMLRARSTCPRAAG